MVGNSGGSQNGKCPSHPPLLLPLLWPTFQKTLVKLYRAEALFYLSLSVLVYLSMSLSVLISLSLPLSLSVPVSLTLQIILLLSVRTL